MLEMHLKNINDNDAYHLRIGKSLRYKNLKSKIINILITKY